MVNTNLKRIKEKKGKEKKLPYLYTVALMITRATPHRMRRLEAYNAIIGIIAKCQGMLHMPKDCGHPLFIGVCITHQSTLVFE
jgi:hypothetical protein